jgi:hypothetical protein
MFGVYHYTRFLLTYQRYQRKSKRTFRAVALPKKFYTKSRMSSRLTALRSSVSTETGLPDGRPGFNS